MESLNNVAGVSSSCVLATYGHRVIRGPADLSDHQRETLTDVLLPAKTKLMGEDSLEPTTSEMNRFLLDVFNMWASGRYHALPDPNSLTIGMFSQTVAIARLDESVPTDKEIRAELKRRKLSTKVLKSRAHKRIVGGYNIRTAHRDRMRSAIVRMRANLNNGMVNAQLVTANGAILPDTCKMTYLAGMSELDAYNTAFDFHDQHEVKQVNDYNIGIAKFIARNLITTWANGAEVSDDPVEEAFQELLGLMAPVETIRDSAVSFSNNEMYQACEMLKQRPGPTLYPGLTEDSEDEDDMPIDSQSAQT